MIAAKLSAFISLHFLAFVASIYQSLSCAYIHCPVRNVIYFPAAHEQEQPSPKASPKTNKHGKGMYIISYKIGCG
jgi:hypothetical protein